MEIKNNMTLIMIQLFILIMSFNLSYEKIIKRKENIIKKMRWLEETDVETSDEEITSSDLDTDSDDNPTTNGTLTDIITEDSTTSEVTGTTAITSEVSHTETTIPLPTTISTTTSPANDTTFDTGNTTVINTTKSSSGLSTGEIIGISIDVPTVGGLIVTGTAVLFGATAAAGTAAAGAGGAAAVGAAAAGAGGVVTAGAGGVVAAEVKKKKAEKKLSDGDNKNLTEVNNKSSDIEQINNESTIQNLNVSQELPIQKQVDKIQPQQPPHILEKRSAKPVLPNYPINKLGPPIVNKVFQPMYKQQPAIRHEGQIVQMIPVQQVEMVPVQQVEMVPIQEVVLVKQIEMIPTLEIVPIHQGGMLPAHEKIPVLKIESRSMHEVVSHPIPFHHPVPLKQMIPENIPPLTQVNVPL